MDRSTSSSSSSGNSPHFLWNVEHIQFTWSIENFNFFTRGESLNSPTFTYDTYSSTDWFLELNPECEKMDGKYYLSVYLGREERDCGPESVLVNYKLSIRRNGILLWEAEYDDYFREGSELESVIELEEDLLNFPSPYTLVSEDTLTVICEMFIHANRKQTDVTQSDMMPEYEQLSLDMANLYKREKFFDITLVTADGNIRAHKHILAARSDSFRKVLENEAPDIINLRRVSIDTLEKLLWYIYTGNFFVTEADGTLLFQICSYADEFELEHLQQLLAPNKICGNTKIKVQHSEFKWWIDDFRFCEGKPEAFIRSPCFGTGEKESEIWILKLYPKSWEDDNFMGIQAEVTNVTRNLQVWIDLSIRNSDVMHSNSVTSLFQLVEKNECLKFPKFLQRDQLSGNSLSIQCRLRVNESFKVTEELTLLTITTLPNSRLSSLKALSDDLYKLQDKGYFSDMYVLSKEKRFMLHKAILWARCSVLAKYMDIDSTTNAFRNVDMESIILKKVIVYIYSAQLENLDPYGAICLYLAAEKFSLSSVVAKCSQFLMCNLRNENVSSVITLASCVEDKKLKKAAMKYIYENSDQVFATEEWKRSSVTFNQILENVQRMVFKMREAKSLTTEEKKSKTGVS